MTRVYTSYSEFWPHYLREHAKPLTRVFHYVGTAIAIILLLTALVSGKWLVLLGVPLAGYAFAWAAHLMVENNKPATFSYPLWSLMSDFRMFYHFLTGGLERELTKAGVAC
jgi:hypothetical protein